VLAGISHDLRTPLARMQLEVELAGLSDEARKGMQADLEQMDAIIGQFLDYAKPSEDVRLERVDLSALFRQAGNEAQRLNDVVGTTDIADVIVVNGNPVELQRIVSNLIENARRYGKRAPDTSVQLDIRCEADSERVMLEIGDHGNGVPDADIARLLRPFTRMDEARSQANGSGLGLAIVERIVKRHGGRLLLSNRDSG